MSDPMSEHGCHNCLFDPSCIKGAKKVHGWCASWRNFADRIKEALPKEKKFSLEKLIDDHWQYNKDFASYLTPYARVEWETSDLLALVEFTYKSAFRHGFKHALEHYGIEEKSDE